jgi:hypothetical protein
MEPPEEIEKAVNKSVNSFGEEILRELALWKSKQNYL